MRARTGGEFTAKDFRTLHGTVSAAIALARSGPASTERARSKAIAAAVRATALQLGNTPAVARSSYIDPRVFDRYASGVVIDPSRSAESQLRDLLGG